MCRLIKKKILIVGRSEHYFQAVVEKLVAILETSHTGVAQAVQVTSVIGPRKEQYKIIRNEQKNTHIMCDTMTIN